MPMLELDETAPIRHYEAWMLEPDGNGGREVLDDCSRCCDPHDTLADARETHRMHRSWNAIVAIETDANGVQEVVKEYRHNPRRPKGGYT